MPKRLKQALLTIFNAALHKVIPQNLLKEQVHFHDGKLTIKDISFNVDHNIHVVGFGKAVHGMAKFFEDLLGEHIVSGALSIPVGTLKSLDEHERLSSESRVVVMEGAKNNLPDQQAEKSARVIVDLVSQLSQDDLLLVLISGWLIL